MPRVFLYCRWLIMNKQAMVKIIDALRERQHTEKSDASSIDPAHFYPISPVSSAMSSELLSVKIASVDGGQAELFATPTYAVYVLRVASVVYRQNQCLQRSSQMWFALLSLANDLLVVDLFDEQGMHRKEKFLLSSISSLPQPEDFLSFSPYAGFVRASLELQECQHLAEQLSSGDLLLRDGLLSNLAVHPQLSELSVSCQRHGIVLLGFAKTTTLKTEHGESFPGALARVAPQGRWYYTTEYTSHLGVFSTTFATSFVKLHYKAQYIFHVETLSDGDPFPLFSQLAHHACDPIFLGYPYGLIAVDQLARVSNQEQSYFKTLFESRSGSLWKELEPQRNAVNAHHILDRIH